ncbi:MAG: lamin tail domain-containing protein [Acidimicrobiia bacterium]
MLKRPSFLLIVATVLVAGACDARPQAPEFVETSTTTTTLAGNVVATTTTPTLPPVEERIVGTVVEVIDGDTVTATVDGVSTTVRMLGINAPESTECWGAEATAILSNEIAGRNVLLVAGEEDVDGFGRALRFVYLETPEGGVEFVNEFMVAEGHAVALQNGNEHAQNLKALEARAFQSGKGMWGTFACGDDEGVSADRPVIRVQELEFDPTGPDDDALDGEYITIVNEGYGRVSISGWVLRDESSTNRLTFPSGIVLAVGDTVTVVTGCEGGPAEAIHWCSDTPVWSNGGDTAIVLDTLGNAVIWYSYSGT